MNECRHTTRIFPGVTCEKPSGHDGGHGNIRPKPMVDKRGRPSGPYFAWTDDAP